MLFIFYYENQRITQKDERKVTSFRHQIVERSDANNDVSKRRRERRSVVNPTSTTAKTTTTRASMTSNKKNRKTINRLFKT